MENGKTKKDFQNDDGNDLQGQDVADLINSKTEIAMTTGAQLDSAAEAINADLTGANNKTEKLAAIVAKLTEDGELDEAGNRAGEDATMARLVAAHVQVQ